MYGAIDCFQLIMQHASAAGAACAGGRVSLLLFVATLALGKGDGFAPAGLIETFTGVGWANTRRL